MDKIHQKVLLSTLLLFFMSQNTYANSVNKKDTNLYYYNGAKKVFITKASSHLRGIDDDKEQSCEVFIKNKETICLNNQIIIKTQKNIDEILKKYNLKYDKKLLGGSYLVSVKNQKNTLQIANKLFEDKQVEYAYPNFRRKTPYRITSDPLSSKAWYLKNTEQKRFYKLGADINILGAWAIATKKGAGIRIGILDDGVEPDHVDIGPHVGYSIDAPTNGNPEHFAKNTKHHGTKVATIITGLENTVGSVGVANKASLYIVNIDETSKASEVIDAFDYMLTKGVDVVSNSWGTYDVPSPIVDAINELTTKGRKGRGTIVIFSVGNDNRNLDDIDINDESEIPSVIGVGGSTPYDSRYRLSNYGSNMDLVAPAEDIWVGNKNDYELDSGTSFSAPIVAGIVALMLEVNPDLTSSEVSGILTNTADKIGTNLYENKFNKYYGYGRVDAYSAVREAQAQKGITKSELESAEEYVMTVNKGWNLLSVPVQKTLHYDDFYTYFDKGSDIVSLKDQSYNFYVKSLYPAQAFWLFSKRKYDVIFQGNDFNVTNEGYILELGWNMVGTSTNTSASLFKVLTKSILVHSYDAEKQIWDFSPDELIRGQGLFIYKDQL